MPRSVGLRWDISVGSITITISMFQYDDDCKTVYEDKCSTQYITVDEQVQRETLALDRSV